MWVRAFSALSTSGASVWGCKVASLAVDDTGAVITSRPVSQTVTLGGSVTFAAAASGTPAPTFQWRKDNVDIPGATSASFTIASTVASDAGSSTVVATNSVSSATSNAATLAFNVASIITIQPASQTAVAGHSVTLTAGGQWRACAHLSVAKEWCQYHRRKRQFLHHCKFLTEQRRHPYRHCDQCRGKRHQQWHKPDGAFQFSSDFNSDGQTDILWQNAATGRRALWLMNGIGGGFTPASIANLGFVDNPWVIVK